MLVVTKLRTDVIDKEACSRIKILFVLYKSLLRRYGLTWLSNDNDKISVYHVLSVIRPGPLYLRLQADLKLSH